MCWRRLSLSENCLLHTVHSKVVKSGWASCTCLRSLWPLGNSLLHTEHTNGALWHWRMCLCRWLVCINVSLHMVHGSGFAPVWVRRWLRHSVFCENFFEQTGHSLGVLPGWCWRCLSKVRLVENFKLHKGQSTGKAEVSEVLALLMVWLVDVYWVIRSSKLQYENVLPRNGSNAPVQVLSSMISD